MKPIPLQEPPARRTPAGFALFALGFRPFFLLAGLGSVLLMALWVGAYAAGRAPSAHYGFIPWHAHEMFFGYTLAVVAGFLLTAVRNWTGVQTLHGRPLAALAGLWLLARLLPLIPVVPGWLVAGVDLAFLPLLALALFAPIHRAAHRKSYVFVLLLALIWLADLLVQLDLLGVVAGVYARALYAAVDLLMVIVAVIGGRVIPFFIERALPGATPRSRWWVDRAALAGVAALALLDALGGDRVAPWLMASAAALAALANGGRLWGWHVPRLWGVPLLWVLFLGYGWLVLGLALKALAAYGLVSPLLALHALTAGTIGVLTLGMMPRVSIGHTGRDMCAPRFIPTAFVLVALAATVRVLLPIVWPGGYAGWVVLSGVLWVAAFGVFVVVFTPILLRPRVDGMPG